MAVILRKRLATPGSGAYIHRAFHPREVHAMRSLSLAVCLLAVAAPLAADEKTGTQQTIEYVRKLQTVGGGFPPSAPMPGEKVAPPTLRATSAAIRALHYLGGKVTSHGAAAHF